MVYVHEDPSGPDLEGELLHVGSPGDPQVQVKGRRAVCLRAGAPGVPFGLCIVQTLLSPRLGNRGGIRSVGPLVVPAAAGVRTPWVDASCARGC